MCSRDRNSVIITYLNEEPWQVILTKKVTGVLQLYTIPKAAFLPGGLCVSFVFQSLENKDGKNHQNFSSDHTAFFISFYRISVHGWTLPGVMNPIC